MSRPIERSASPAITQEIADDVARLQEAMSKRRWPRTTLVGFGGVVGAALGLAAGTLGSGSPLELGLAAGAGVTALGQAGYNVREQLREPVFDARSPLAYAALASRL